MMGDRIMGILFYLTIIEQGFEALHINIVIYTFLKFQGNVIDFLFIKLLHYYTYDCYYNKMLHNIVISPAQCKAGRDLLGWTQQDLKEYSGVSANTIATFEKGSRSLTIKTMEKLVDAFYRYGVRFENNSNEVVVRLLLNGV